MINTNETKIEEDPSGKKLIITRGFNAPVNRVWRAWTEAELLDKWWAPRPWKAETKEMFFKNGGHRLYAMVSPEGERKPCPVKFESIIENKVFTSISWFCDEDGNKTDEMPEMKMINKFEADGQQTKVTIDVIFKSQADLEKVVQMGFRGGFTMAHVNLDELLTRL